MFEGATLIVDILELVHSMEQTEGMTETLKNETLALAFEFCAEGQCSTLVRQNQ